MKNILAYSLLFATLCLVACNAGTSNQKETAVGVTDTLVYHYQTVHERAADCGNRPDSTCTVASITYPLFNNAASLNDTVANRLNRMFIMDDTKPDTSITEMAKKFIRSYTDFKKENPSTLMYYTLDSYAKVLRQDSVLVNLEYGGYIFQGGAHGASFTGFINWDRKNNQEIKLADLITEGAYPALTQIAEGIFRKNEKLTATSSLADAYFFKDNKFALNQNYTITDQGLKFVYNQYEIKPYAAGQTELLIPYSAIQNLLRPNTVLRQFIK